MPSPTSSSRWLRHSVRWRDLGPLTRLGSPGPGRDAPDGHAFGRGDVTGWRPGFRGAGGPLGLGRAVGGRVTLAEVVVDQLALLSEQLVEVPVHVLFADRLG